MDARKLGSNLFWIGLALLAAGIAWWFVAYGDIPSELGEARGQLIKCVAGLGFECTIANAMTGYSPAPFWIGLVMAIAGFVIRRSAKPAGGA